ncbi:cysteine methyltransferase [Solibacillus sp. R5-41]|uniref:methylated-DNA--[protein]-cysteine S-methyltransferase n=1 Tax=Solibacillus sp. R5-41 TaxID=2048654 RepID=UPI000C126C43|nr:methylated-DNA--[protein]-cysteine S-methyltransferase [Solibacillus sp. R5-41]ATP42260.1 cysteine methyltransferase [Solibacillus sp. R5-41]
MYRLDVSSPLGMVEITSTENAITAVLFVDREETIHEQTSETPTVLKDCYEQLIQYFNGERTKFTVPYEMYGTDFQKSVWTALTTVPFAKTESYKDIAIKVGNEKAVRAVGTTNGKNPISIIVPCHRIIGANGKLTGYAGGLWRKEWLLMHEQKMAKE